MRSEYMANLEMATGSKSESDMERWMKANAKADKIRRAAAARKANTKPRWWEGWFAW